MTQKIVESYFVRSHRPTLDTQTATGASDWLRGGCASCRGRTSLGLPPIIRHRAWVCEQNGSRIGALPFPDEIFVTEVTCCELIRAATTLRSTVKFTTAGVV